MTQCSRFAVAGVSLLAWLCLIETTCAAGPFQYRPHELQFTSTRDLADPFDPEKTPLAVHFKHESGRTLIVRGFWDGGRTWRVRFQPELAGRWTWTSVADDPADSGLHARSGQWDVTPPEAGGPEQQAHGGVLRVSADCSHLTYADGTPFFWLADTWWAMPRHDATVDQFARIIAKRQSQGFTLAQIHGHQSLEAQGRPDVFQLIEAGGAEALAHWRKADAYYRCAEEQGWHLCVGFYSYDSEKKYSLAAHHRLWAYFLARYGAYPITFLITQEYNQPYELGPGADGKMRYDASRTHGPFFVSLGRWIHERDPYRRAMTAHSAVRSREKFDAWPEPWYGFALLQNGHFTRPNPAYYRSVIAQEPRRPVIEGETNYEGFVRSVPPEFRVDSNAIRASAYGAIQSGCIGFSYGAQGLYGHVTDTKKPGASSRWGPALTWDQGMELEGAAHLAHFAALYRGLAWWRLRPMPKAIDGSETVLGMTDDKGTCVVYFPTASSAAPVPSRLSGLGVPGARFAAEWFDPRTGQRTPVPPPTWKDDTLVLPTRPDNRDWVLLLRGD